MGARGGRFAVAWIVALGIAGFFAAPLFVTSGGILPLRVEMGDGDAARRDLWLLTIAVQGGLWGVSLPVLLGWLLLKESYGRLRLLASAGMVAGLVLVATA